jgi:hypothetical protein
MANKDPLGILTRRRIAWYDRLTDHVRSNRWSEDYIAAKRLRMEEMARIIDARDAAFLIEITRMCGLQRELRLVVRAWRRKVRRRLWKVSRAVRYHNKPTSVPIGAPELEDGFENAIFPESDSDPPNMLPAWLLPARWTPPDHCTAQLAPRLWYSTSTETKSRFIREPIDADYTPTSTPPTTPPYDPLTPSSHTSPPRLTLQQLRIQQQQPLQRSYQQHFNQATRYKSPSYQRYQRLLPYDHFHQRQRKYRDPTYFAQVQGRCATGLRGFPRSSGGSIRLDRRNHRLLQQVNLHIRAPSYRIG